MTGRFDFGAQGRKATPVTRVVTTASLFDAPRPEGWRAPTMGEATCGGCGGAACYGQGFGPGALTWCRSCVPAGFLPLVAVAA